jgi:multiple sugar transport system ATP-binding protein
MNDCKLELVSLSKEYDDGNVVAVDGINLQVQAGETIALLGSSGCGKSTTLNMIVGLETPTSGDILVDGRSIVALPPGKRDVGLVFQDYAVFTSMSVRKNLAFGLEVRGKGRAEIEQAVDEVAELLGMSDRLDVRAKELGGSELQRVAIGRTLVTKPSILLLDEPLSNLETAARLAMRTELRRLQSEIGLTIIYVTHDQVEAFSLADRIAVMDAGKILQVEKTAVICDKPDHTFVAGFLGFPPMNLLRGKFEGEPGAKGFNNGTFTLPVPDTAALPQGICTMGIRPEALHLAAADKAVMSGQVVLLEPRGPESVLTVTVGLTKLKALVASDVRLREGETVGLSLDYETVKFFDGEKYRSMEFKLSGGQLS